ncbi:unnamed protein product [Rotaria sordida]|uniref:Carbonic anhydrase n=1 Tax=Rotaria sordida TaxID=392033 RepID=A0A815R5J3_9BILA|nr:unnamed protein product [Rotaria sordida]CAF1472242.1 unnamed protein product [Rotaria sordida]CAF1505343.1 unnamed protein product [Rotaria sordida]CAF3992936.1 unnamed protein product [Rotaria sordida]CAF4114487.1 unnamed protein product [Rotaria sordida]
MSCTEETDDHWSYYNPSKWHEHFPDASGTSQSPIDIKFHETVAQQFPPFEFSPDHQREINFTLTNNGHQVAVTLSKDSENLNQTDLSFTGGGLTGKFNFVNFHLHWGRKDRHGSEHEINGHTFPAEGHFVYKDLETQQTAVLAFFFYVVHSENEENSEWKKYTHIASLLTNIGDTMNCALNLSHLMQIEKRRFFRYMGSLTTPPCTEGIIWTVFLDPIGITEESLNLLRNNVMRRTYRPVQPINDRIIHRNHGH